MSAVSMLTDLCVLELTTASADGLSPQDLGHWGGLDFVEQAVAAISGQGSTHATPKLTNEATRGADHRPSATASGMAFVVTLPREFRADEPSRAPYRTSRKPLRAPKPISPSAAPLNVRCASSTRSRKSSSQTSVSTIRQRPAKALR